MIKEKVMQDYNLQKDFIEQISGKKSVEKNVTGIDQRK